MFTAYIDQCDNVSGERTQNYSGRKIRSFAHHTIQGGLPKLGRPVCVACRITESEQCSHQTGYWPSLEVSVANYLNFLVVGGDTDKKLFPSFVSVRRLHFGSCKCVRGNKETIINLAAIFLDKNTCRLVRRNSRHKPSQTDISCQPRKENIDAGKVLTSLAP